MFKRILIDRTYRSYMIDRNVLPDIIVPDDEEVFDEREFKLIPFLYLIGEEIIEASDDYSKNMQSPSFVKRAYNIEQGRPHIIDLGKNGEGIFFSPWKYYKAAVLKCQGITMENSVLLLAAAGLEITVPNLTFNIAYSEEISKIKEKLYEERQNYLHTIAKIADETYQRIQSGFYKDTVDWALNEAFIKIRPKAEAFEISLRKLDKRLLQRIGLTFFQEGIPHIGSITLQKGLKEGAIATVEVILKTLITNLARKLEERKVPEVVYGFKISKRIHLKGK